MFLFKYYLVLIYLNLVLCFKPNHRGFFNLLFNNPAKRCNCRCGIPNRQSRLLGGEYLENHEFPWLVTIPIRGVISLTGVLINDQYVLTAASPLSGVTPYDIKVTLGQYDACMPDVTSSNVSVDTLIIHPDFNMGNRAHDLALLRLANVVPLERRIKPICLPNTATNYLGQVATVASWAIKKSNNTGLVDATCRPRKLGLPVLGSIECMTNIKDTQNFNPDNGCVGVIGIPSPICQDDVGSPILFRSYRKIYELIGILTEKNDCRVEPSIAIYTKINENIKWLLQNTEDACYCSKY